MWNNNRIERKPIPQKKRLEFKKMAEEYTEFKIAEEMRLKKEGLKFIENKLKAS